MTPTVTEQPPPLPGQRPSQRRPANDDLWDTILTGKNLFRVGLALVLLGLVFMFRYAVEAGWVTAAARVGLGAAASVAMLGLGAKLVPSRRGFGTLLAGGGVAGLYLTGYAAFEWYSLTAASSAFIQLVVVSILAVGLALFWDAESLGVAGLVGALIAPLVLPGRMLQGSGDAFYFLTILGAAVALFLIREWVVLYATTFVMAVLVVGFEALRVARDLGGASLLEIDVMLAGIVVAFLVAPSIARLVGTVLDTRLSLGAGAVGPVVFAIAYLAHAGESTVLASTAFVLAGLHGLVAFSMRDDDALGVTHALVGAALAAVGSAVLLDGPAAVLAITVVAAAVTIIGFHSEAVGPKWAGGLALAGAGYLNIATLVDLGGSGDSVARVAVIGIIGLVAIALDRQSGSDATVGRNFAAGYVYLAGFLVGLIDLASYSQALTTAVWSAIAVGLILYGSVAERRTIMRLGLGTMAGILVKVFLIDLATVETIWKMALFLALGVVLLMVGFWISNED